MNNKAIRAMAASIAGVLGAAHFGVSKLHRALYPGRHPAWIPIDSDGLRHKMAILVCHGLAAESKGPRGGSGWTLTPAGLRRAGIKSNKE